MQDAMGPLPLETLLVSMDVTSSTPIFHMKMVSKRPGNHCERPPTQILIKLLTLVLKCNNSEFNG